MTGEDLTKLEDAMHTAEVEAHRTPSRRSVQRIAQRSARWSQSAVVASLIIALLSMSFSAYLAILVGDNSARVAVTQEGVESLRKANEELRALGLPEIPIPENGTSLDADSLAAAAAAILRREIQNDPTFRGPQGVPGSSGAKGPIGDPGREGKPGRTGPRGLNGEDGKSLPGPEGPQGPKGDKGDPCDPSNPACVGPMGPRGPEGPQGQPGMPPCPDGYTPRWESRPQDGSLMLVCDPSQG